MAGRYESRDVRYAEPEIMREYLESLARLLRQEGHNARAILVEDAISGPDAELDVFLTSNELWGGSGSIADCGGIRRRAHSTAPEYRMTSH